MTAALVPASLERLADYADALRRGWSSNTIIDTAGAELAEIAADPVRFVARCEDIAAVGGPVPLPDDSTASRLPGVKRWIWDGAFCGQLGFRWQPGTADLPPHVLGHIGFAVVPWKRGRGYAADAVRAILPFARAQGLTHVDLTTDTGNIASQRSIERAGGVLVERFAKPAAYGGGEALRYRVALD